jgi:hypothetical protein
MQSDFLPGGLNLPVEALAPPPPPVAALIREFFARDIAASVVRNRESWVGLRDVLEEWGRLQAAII